MPSPRDQRARARETRRARTHRTGDGGQTFADLRAVTFDPVHATGVGIPVARVRFLLMALISVTVVVSLDTVGLLMSVAMLVTPAASARLLTNRISTMTAVAVLIGTTSAVGGLTASYHLATPPGPTIALFAVAWFTVAAAATWPQRRHRHHSPAGA